VKQHRFAFAALLVAFAPSRAASQQTAPSLASSEAETSRGTSDESVVIAAGARYKAGGFHRWLLGDTYRDLWGRPMRVQVLNLRTFAGGLRPDKVGGGNTTRSLRFLNPEGVDYVFRMVDKSKLTTPKRLKGTVVEKIFRDQVSASHPAGALLAAPMLDAAGVLHVTPVFVVMPDDPVLGEFRAEFAGTLGMIEQYPSKPKDGDGFAGAIKVIDSDELLALLDSDAGQRFDAPALLTARLMDMLINDWDRHGGQWKWARFQPGAGSLWEPISRDRDHAFTASGGVVMGVARKSYPNMVVFQGSLPSVRAMTWNSLEFDRRMLGGLEKPVWDSVVGQLVRRVTDAVIETGVHALPAEYQSSAPLMAQTLKQRRDGLPDMANRFYYALAAVADIHATDAADRATITRVNDGIVEVRLQSGEGAPYFLRRFDARETSEIRVYLHGGDDSAFVTGKVQRSIPVRIIGGNGTNRLIDSSRVDGHGHRGHLYDVGHRKGVEYPKDTFFNRRPWVKQDGHLLLPGRDRGTSITPVVGLGTYRDLGVVPSLGVRKYRYSFRHRPYSSMVGLRADYSSGLNGFRVAFLWDKRREDSPVHFALTAQMSQLEMVSFYGYGNDVPSAASIAFFDARHRQWLLQPAIARSYGLRSELYVGPVVQYTVTDSTPDKFLSLTQPYGFGRFGQVGLRLGLHHDTRDVPRDPGRGLTLDLTGNVYPALWDVTSEYAAIEGVATTYLRFPIPMHPVLVLRGVGKQLYGAFPFHDAAFIGGRNMLRSVDTQRYAGDASLYGGAELRVRLARFGYILPWDIGIFGMADAGRVFVAGESPGGWHKTAGVGFWIGVPDPSTAIRVCRRLDASGRC